MEKRTEFNIWYWIVAFFAVIFIQDLIASWRMRCVPPALRHRDWMR